MRIGEHVEQTRYVGSLPEQTWLGWLLYLMSAHCPFTVAVHLHATDRTHERLFHKRRYRRIHGNNRGTEMRGRPLDPDQQAQEAEAAELNADLPLRPRSSGRRRGAGRDTRRHRPRALGGE